jgi:hypothetical protein
METMNMTSAQSAATTIIHRPMGGLSGYRKIFDRASRVCVHGFPASMLTQLAGAGLLSSPGAYVLTDHSSAYFGESGRPGRRLLEHAADSGKKFFMEGFVVSGCDGSPFDRIQILDLQYRMTNSAVEAGLVTVVKGVSPPESGAAECDRATHHRIFDDAKRLLFDAGCRFFDPHGSRLPPITAPTGEEMSDTTSDFGPMEIGVTTTPPGAAEFELNYSDLFARGYWAAGHFIVAAGSEMRLLANESTNSLTLSRRADLDRAGVLSDIPGVADRRRLTTAVAFPSISIAAKILCGAHTSGHRWIPLRPSRPIILEAGRCTPRARDAGLLAASEWRMDAFASPT